MGRKRSGTKKTAKARDLSARKGANVKGGWAWGKPSRASERRSRRRRAKGNADWSIGATQRRPPSAGAVTRERAVSPG